MFNHWEDGLTYESFERQQRHNCYHCEEDVIEKRFYWIDWYNEEFSDSELVSAYCEEEAEEEAMKNLPANAVVTGVRVA